ncbi:MAG: T9SS type A sorting domain-containing protein [Flavobacteriales bacterium]|nr:T9SS type A sorting domain-containing protein [Flavobacteriales bacterium]
MRTLSAVLIICSTSLHAQPELLREEMLPYGAVVPYRYYNNFAAVDTTVQGAGVTWDMTGLTPQAGTPPFSLTMVDPADTPHDAVVSTDNYAYWEQPSNFYRFFELTPTYMQRVGSYGTSAYVYQDPQIEYVFPLSYGVTHTDDWVGVTDAGQYIINCVGYGTLQLPGITIEDVLMVRADVSGYLYDIDTYLWYSSTDGRILVQYINSWVASVGLYFDGEAVGVQEPQAFEPQLLMNPAQDELRFVLGEVPGPIDLTVRSTSGALLAQGPVRGSAGVVQTVDISTFSPGMYILQLNDRSGKHSSAVPFMKM